MHSDIQEEHILFNALKHHLQRQIQLSLLAESTEFYSELLSLGGSVMDVYAGALSVHELHSNCCHVLQQAKIQTEEQYRTQIFSAGGYFTATFSDTSKWVFRLGEQPERFVHIHPARQSPFTFRVRANHLKTILSSLFEEMETLDIEKLNELRKEHLQLPPLKGEEHCKGLSKLWRFYQAQLIHKTKSEDENGS